MKIVEVLKKFSSKNILYLLVLVAVLLLLFSGGSENKSKEKAVVKEDNYYEETTQRFEEILSKIKGAGKVSVMFVMENKGEFIPVFDKKISTDETNKKNDSESKAVLYGQGNNEQPYISEEKNPQISGVIVVAEGADNENVKIEIFEALRALLGVPAHRIKVWTAVK